MRHLALALAAALPLGACVTLKLHPVAFNAPAPELGLSAEQRLPLNVAVVIPDPMGLRYYYTPPAMAAGGARRMDQTDQLQGDKGLPLGGELARLVDQSFPAAFQHAAVLRQLPAPGEYDAVVELSVASIDQVAYMKGAGFGGVDSEMWMDWKMTVLDKKNVEVFSGKSVTEKRRFNVPAGFTAEPMLQAIGREGGMLLAQITKEAALSSRSELAKRLQ
jgi:hypothetical protein